MKWNSKACKVKIYNLFFICTSKFFLTPSEVIVKTILIPRQLQRRDSITFIRSLISSKSLISNQCTTQKTGLLCPPSPLLYPTPINSASCQSETTGKAWPRGPYPVNFSHFKKRQSSIYCLLPASCKHVKHMKMGLGGKIFQGCTSSENWEFTISYFLKWHLVFLLLY